MLEFRQLRYFAHIAELGSFSQASRYLGIAQPALSSHVAALETQLGIKLFLRTPRGVTVTADGERLLRHAREILARLARAEDEMRVEVPDLAGPPVAVGLIPSLTGSFAVPMLERLREKYPKFRVRLLDALSDQVVDWLLAGQVQIGFSTLRRHPKRVAVEPIVRERLSLVTPPGFLKRRSSTISFAEVTRMPLILNPRPNSVRTTLDEVAAEQGLDLNVALEFDAYSVIKEAVRRGFGCSVLSWGAVAEDCVAGRLTAYRIVRPALSRPLQLISAKEHLLSQSGRILKLEILALAREFAQDGRFQ